MSQREHSACMTDISCHGHTINMNIVCVFCMLFRVVCMCQDVCAGPKTYSMHVLVSGDGH
jgi:hypothetical protein